ncbi:MAG: zinc ribbon domain-containing protein [Chloroflexi bacterium]|nr:zinc ribbon domain-containing protein [Chloroflexota bacterium]
MDIGSILISVALFLLVAAFVARPLLERVGVADGSDSPADNLLTQREAVLIELRDLDFDHETGKVSHDDYATQRARLVAKGVEVLRALSAIGKNESPAPASDDFDDAIEKAVAARRRRKATPASAGHVDDEIEKAVAARRKMKTIPAEANVETEAAPAPGRDLNDNGRLAKFCSHCGAAAQPGDKFCARCGASLALTPEST